MIGLLELTFARYSSQLHQRERTSLFDQPQRVSSPYEKQAKSDFNESELSHLESQNDDEMGVMSTKIQQLKGVSILCNVCFYYIGATSLTVVYL